MSTIMKLSPSISLIDGYDSNLTYRTGTYVLHEEKTTLIESGPSPSVSYVLEGLSALNIHPADVAYLIVTHIHLDHAGGAGLLLRHCPNAKLIVHPRGSRHMINPSRLIDGAKAVYGERFDSLFDPIIPVAQERIIELHDRESVNIGEGSTLTFYDTPGHSNHHFSIHDSKSNGIFTGDTLGVHYELLQKEGHHFVLPSTSPSQFDPHALIKSLELIEELNVDAIYFGHFSASYQPSLVFQQIREWLPHFVSQGQAIFDKQGNEKDLAETLHLMIQSELDQKKIPRSHPVYEHIHLDLQVCSLGILQYFQKQVQQ
ncbi:MBL fold metallo-hydrolase [Halalkalibacter okhensis]|uniref:Beta-lactamase n=1 Tax=Halalkalibacter okhensis TaxID=333138 RepID=A0A0B0IKT6_9BACI|nr:MBL fold metallo-hydrolase [Halalkalibacter okhensis]KHF40276.1 beta-lactamase [Halalkalibacter okhensis]